MGVIMANTIKNLFLLDYNDTIVLGVEKVGYSFLESFIGEDKFKELKASNAKGNSIYEKYINDDNFTLSYEDAKKNWENFKESLYVRKIKQDKFPRTTAKFDEIDSLFQKKQDIDYKKYCYDNIIAPLVAMYNVYVTGVRPENSFRDFMSRQAPSPSKDCDNLMIINTGGPEVIVKKELEEYIHLDRDKYGYLNYFLANDLVFGSNASLSKKDDGRVNTLIEILKDRKYNIDDNTHVVIVGDTEKDLKNYEQFDSINIKNPRSVYILTNRVDNYEDLNKRVLESSENMKRLEKLSARLEEVGKRIKTNKMDKGINKDELEEEKRFYETRKIKALKEIHTIEDRKKSLEQKKLLTQGNKSYKFVKTFNGVSM